MHHTLNGMKNKQYDKKAWAQKRANSPSPLRPTFPNAFLSNLGRCIRKSTDHKMVALQSTYTLVEEVEKEEAATAGVGDEFGMVFGRKAMETKIIMFCRWRGR